MRPEDVSIIIPTRNRLKLLVRAVDSALEARFPEENVIVVDDESTDGTGSVVRRRFGRAAVIELDRQSGPGAARNAGLRKVNTRYALMLDDDDTIRCDAFATISEAIGGSAEEWPVSQFATGNARMPSSYQILRLGDYVRQSVIGDFSALVCVPAFRRLGFEYPQSVIGGESLLWLQIARAVGIPTWSSPVVNVTHDAPSRLCSAQSQLARAGDYARSIEAILEALGSEIRSLSPAFYRRKRLGAAVYRLLAGDRAKAVGHALALGRQGYLLWCASVVMSAGLPPALLRRLFGIWRQRAFA